MIGAVGATPDIDSPSETAALSSTLATLAGEGRTGVLRIGTGGEVWLCEGRIYLALTGTSPDLAKVLYDTEVAPVDAIAAALSNGAPVRYRPGAVNAFDRLVAERPEAEDPLRRLVHELSLNALFELLVPSPARCHFESDVVHPIGVRFAQDTGDLMASARRRIEIWRRIAARIPSTSAVFRLTPALPEGGERLISADEWRFLARLDGRRTVADIIAETGESAFRVCSSLYRLLLEEIILDAA
jgi:hypothetical protein